MVNEIGIGNVNSPKSMVYNEIHDDKISDLLKSLNDTQRRVVESIVNKDPGQGWGELALELDLSVRQLYNIRRDPRVREVILLLTKQLLEDDLGDVLRVLSRKARAGELQAIRLFLEAVISMSKDSQSFDDNSSIIPINPEDHLRIGNDD